MARQPFMAPRPGRAGTPTAPPGSRVGGVFGSSFAGNGSPFMAPQPGKAGRPKPFHPYKPQDQHALKVSSRKATKGLDSSAIRKRVLALQKRYAQSNSAAQKARLHARLAGTRQNLVIRKNRKFLPKGFGGHKVAGNRDALLHEMFGRKAYNRLFAERTRPDVGPIKQR